MMEQDPTAEPGGYPDAGPSTEVIAQKTGELPVYQPAGAEAAAAVDELSSSAVESIAISSNSDSLVDPSYTAAPDLGPAGSSPGGATDAEAPGVTAAPALETLQEVPAKEAPAAADTSIDSPKDFQAALLEEPPSSVLANTLAEEAALVVPGSSDPKPELAPGGRVPVREYLDSTVVPVLREGLRKLCKERPEDPLNYLGDFIKAYSPPPPTLEPFATGA